MTEPDHAAAAPTDTPGPDGRPQPAQETPPAPPSGRQWTEVGESFLRKVFANTPSGLDLDRERARISEQINQLEWRLPFGMFAFSAAQFLMEVIQQLPLASVSAVAVNGLLTCPDGPETADYSLYGIEGTSHGARNRVYMLDTGTSGVPLVVDYDVPDPAITPPPHSRKDATGMDPN